MLIGRFLMIVPALAIAGILAGKKTRAARTGHAARRTAPLFAALLVGVVLIVGALTFFPALAWARSSSTSSCSPERCSEP